MKIKDVVRGVEEKEAHNKACDCHNCYEVDGYNSLASAEVVVDIVALGQALRKHLDTFPVDVNLTMLRDMGIDYQNLIRRSLESIATAIESGAVISLKKEG